MRNYAALSSLCLSALLTVSLVHAQVNPADTAADVAVRFQARVLEAQQLVADARVSEARREIQFASQQYNKALERVQGIGEIAEGVRLQAIEGLARTTLQLADQAIKRSDFVEAKLHIDRVLKVDPRNELALRMRAENDRLMLENQDKMPHPEALATIASTETNRIEVARMVQDGKLYYETGRLKKAEEVLREAIRLNPGDVSAAYYLDLVNARRFAAEARLREANSKGLLMEIEREWTKPITQSALEVPNPYARTNLVQTSPERQLLYQKMRSIRLRQWGPIDNLPLSEVIRSLTDEAKRSDLDKKGINIIVSPNADATGAGPGPAGAVDAAGLPIAAGPEPTDLNGVGIRLGTTLNDLTLEQVLNILTTIADRKIKFSVEDYGIIISPKQTEPVPLHTRFFRVDPNTFQQGLANVTAFSFGESQSGSGGGGGGGRGGGGGGRGNRGGGGFGGGGGGFGGGGGQFGQGQGGGAIYAGVSIAPGGAQGLGGQQQRRVLGGGVPGVQGAGAGAGAGGAQQTGGGVAFLTEVTPAEIVIPTVRSFFLTAGVDLSTVGKAVFWNDRLGMLMVRATLQDLDTIEKGVQMLNMSAPQMTIRAKFMEVAQEDTRALGFDWYLGNTLFSDNRIGAQGGSAPSLTAPGASSTANPGGWFPGPSGIPGVPGPNAIPAAATDNLLTSGLRNSAPHVATVTGILTDPQFRFVVRALEQRGGTDLLSAPEVTTQSGRQAQIKVVDIRYIVTDLDTDQTAAGQTTAAVGGTAGGGGIGSLIVPLAEPFEIGPVLDVVPYVNADGYTIQLTILPTLKEFLGYDDPGAFVAQVQGASSIGASPTPLTQPIPLPKFRLRQVATTATVWDGQTVVLGGLIAENVQKTKDKVPVLGDLPFFGRFFRSEQNMSTKKNLVIFVTPTLIDPAGNRLHTDEEMPFAQHSLPVAPRAGIP